MLTVTLLSREDEYMDEQVHYTGPGMYVRDALYIEPGIMTRTVVWTRVEPHEEDMSQAWELWHIPSEQALMSTAHEHGPYRLGV